MSDVLVVNQPVLAARQLEPAWRCCCGTLNDGCGQSGAVCAGCLVEVKYADQVSVRYLMSAVDGADDV